MVFFLARSFQSIFTSHRGEVLPALSLPKGAESNENSQKSHPTKCPIAESTCNNHPKTTQNCQKKRKIVEKIARNHKKCALFTKKYKKITKNTPFFDAFVSQTYPFATNLVFEESKTCKFFQKIRKNPCFFKQVF